MRLDLSPTRSNRSACPAPALRLTRWAASLGAGLLCLMTAFATLSSPAADVQPGAGFTLDYTTPCDAGLQARVTALDAQLRERHGLAATQSAVGVLDLRGGRLALLRPDAMIYGASVPKIGILLAYFTLRPAAAQGLDAATRRELELMIKHSSNEMAAKYSQELGLRELQEVLLRQGLYDTNHGGGLWVGKHYGVSGDRIGDPLQDLSHAVTVRQALRFYLWLEQGKLVSPAASRTMREIFAAPDLPHREDRFVKGLAGRNLEILRKAGWWENWHHDSAIVSGPGRHYLLVALTEHPQGEAYLVDLAAAVDDCLAAPVSQAGAPSVGQPSVPGK